MGTGRPRRRCPSVGRYRTSWLAGRQFAVTVQAMASKTKPSESVPGSPNAYSILGTAYFINDFSLSQLFD